MSPLPCRCGRHAEVDWSSVMETSHGGWQFVTVDCPNPNCGRRVTVEIDANREDGRAAEAAAVAAWNAVQTAQAVSP